MAVAFKNKTISEIRDLIVNSFQIKFNKTFRLLSKSFVRIISVVFAGVYVTLYKQIGWLLLQIFPETAYWGEVEVLGMEICPLVKWGVLVGVGEPKSGEQWRGTMDVTVTRKGAPLIAGTQLKSEITGKLYITEKSVTLENEIETVPIICAENGTSGNLETGDILNFVSPLGIVSRNAVIKNTTEYAIEGESEQEYRTRVVSRFRSPPMGGALADYRIWGQEARGVLNIYPYNDDDSPAGVLIYVSGLPSIFPNRVPTPDLLRQVGCYCTYDPKTGAAKRKPMTAILDPEFDETYNNIRPVKIKYFNVYVTGVAGVPLSDFGAAVLPAVKNYFLNREPYIRGLSDDNNKINIVSRNNVMSIIDQNIILMKAEFDSVFMSHNDEFTAAYTLGTGELAALEHLYLNGVLYE